MYSYGTPIRVRGIMLAHTHIGYPIGVWADMQNTRILLLVSILFLLLYSDPFNPYPIFKFLINILSF